MPTTDKIPKCRKLIIIYRPYQLFCHCSCTFFFHVTIVSCFHINFIFHPMLPRRPYIPIPLLLLLLLFSPAISTRSTEHELLPSPPPVTASHILVFASVLCLSPSLRHSSRGAGSWLFLIIFVFCYFFIFLKSPPSAISLEPIVLFVIKHLVVFSIVFITHLRFLNSFEHRANAVDRNAAAVFVKRNICLIIKKREHG